MPTLRNPRWERFCQRVVAGQTLREAYVVAGYRGDRRDASKLRQSPDISRRISELLAARTEDERRARELAIKSSSMSLGELLAELKRIGSSSIADVCDWDEHGLRVRAKAELTESQLATIQHIREVQFFGPKGNLVSRRLEVRLHDKLGALQKLGMHLGAFEPKNQITMQQVDSFLRAVLKLLENRLGRDQLSSALLELRELSEGAFGTPQLPDSATRH